MAFDVSRPSREKNSNKSKRGSVHVRFCSSIITGSFTKSAAIKLVYRVRSFLRHFQLGSIPSGEYRNNRVYEWDSSDEKIHDTDFSIPSRFLRLSNPLCLPLRFPLSTPSSFQLIAPGKWMLFRNYCYYKGYRRRHRFLGKKLISLRLAFNANAIRCRKCIYARGVGINQLEMSLPKVKGTFRCIFFFIIDDFLPDLYVFKDIRASRLQEIYTAFILSIVNLSGSRRKISWEVVLTY